MNDKYQLKSQIAMLIHQNTHHQTRKQVDRLLMMKLKHRNIYAEVIKENETTNI